MSAEDTNKEPTNEEAFAKAMEELDGLEKSVKEAATDEVDDLTKALEAELGEPLVKSQEELDAEALAKSAKETDGDEGGKKAKDDPAADPEPIAKSADADEYDEELVKASDAFADLTKSIQEGHIGIAGELDCLKKSLAAQMNLTIKLARVIGSMCKSQQEDRETMAKSMADLGSDLGAKPVAPGLARIGLGEGDPLGDLTKSISEVNDLLIKAVQNKEVDSRWLSIFGTHKDVSRLPDDVKKIIGL